MDEDIIIHKLQKQENPTILFSDLDGTLFSPNLNLITAPLFNIQTAFFLREHRIPFIIVTGRSFWRKIDQYHLKLLGIPLPDAVVTANGTIIYYKNQTEYVSDFLWQGVMQSTKVTNENGESKSWNKWEITDAITKYLREHNFVFFLGRGNTYIIRIRFDRFPVKTIEQIKKDILHIFPKGIRIIFTEKLLWENTLTVFSGEMLITPATAGKDKAVQYLLKNFSTRLQKPIHAKIFGDATIDVPMLTMKNDEKYYMLSQFAVHPTPLAKESVEQNQKINTHLQILPGDGPKEILRTLSQVSSVKGKTLSDYVIPAKAGIQSSHHSERSEKSNSWIPDQVRDDSLLSPAQNNKVRKVVRIFETFLDKIIDKNFSPNEISFLGLDKLSLGLSLLHQPKSSILNKTKGLYHYSFGNLTDILDGIRARNSDKKEENGQLVDGFADRTKEFMQLFARAKKRFVIANEVKQSDKSVIPSEVEESQSDVLQTFLTCISCALPSIARAQVEISGKVVSERDEKGGSMIDRTKRLFLSLLLDTVGLTDQSMEKDIEIYKTNIATFHNRLSVIPKTKNSLFVIASEAKQSLTDFQKKALERFLLYVDVLQQEDAIIKKFLSKNTKLLKAYEKESLSLAKNYLQLPLNKLRKKWIIKDYKLQIKNYL